MLKILTLNLNYYGDKHGQWEDRKKLIAQTLREVNADIVAFQAVCADREYAGGKNQAIQFSELLPDYSYCIFSPVAIHSSGRQDGNAIISKHPIQQAETFLLKLVESTDDPVRRLVLKAKFQFSTGPFYLFNAHFSWVKEQTESNIKDALPFINSVSEKALLVGDMNTDPKDKVLQPLKDSGWEDVWENFSSDKDGFTFESDKPFTRIDYAWVNGALKNKVSNIEILNKVKDKNIRMSDHLGLLLDIID